MTSFSKEMIDADKLRSFLEDGGYIDCGKDGDEVLKNVSFIGSLGLPMGGWYYRNLKTNSPILWRYLFLSDYFDEIHMNLHISNDQMKRCIPFESLCERFPAEDVEEDDSALVGLDSLYDWMK